VVFSKDGMRVGVKEVRGDVYVDGTQRFVLFLRLCFWGWALGKGGGWGGKGSMLMCLLVKIVYWSKHGTTPPGRRIRVGFGIRAKAGSSSSSSNRRRCRRGRRESSPFYCSSVWDVLMEICSRARG